MILRHARAGLIALALVGCGQTRTNAPTDTTDSPASPAQTSELELAQQQITSLQAQVAKMKQLMQVDRKHIIALLNDLEQVKGKLAIAEKRKTELTEIAKVAREVAFQLNKKLAETEDDLEKTDAAAELLQRELQILKQAQAAEKAQSAVDEKQDK